MSGIVRWDRHGLAEFQQGNIERRLVLNRGGKANSEIGLRLRQHVSVARKRCTGVHPQAGRYQSFEANATQLLVGS
jgi:hypothetical protein